MRLATVGAILAISACGPVPNDMYCVYQKTRNVGPDHETEQGTPRHFAEGLIGSWRIEPVWLVGDAGWPAPGELGTLHVDISLAEGRVHLLDSDLDPALSADWCPESVASAALVARIQNADGSLWAADPDGEPTAWFGPGPRDLVGERSLLTAHVEILRHPARWDGLPGVQYEGRSPSGYTISTPLPGTGIDQLRIQALHDIPAAGGEYGTGSLFEGMVDRWTAVP